MSEVEAQLMKDMGRALGSLARAAQHVGELFAAYVPEPVKAEQSVEIGSIRFEHTDEDGDWFRVGTRSSKTYPWGLETTDNYIHMGQEAVNGLAQYLDRYRTDQQDCDAEVPEQCGRANPFAHTGYTNGAPVTYPLPTGFDRCTGTYEGLRCRRSVNHEGEHA